MRLICSSDRRSSSAKLNSCVSGSHGGIKCFEVTAAICRARAFASEYVSSGKGPASPGRWHGAQYLKRIGAISRLKVVCCAAGVGGCAAAMAYEAYAATLAEPNPSKHATIVRTEEVIRRPR